MRIAILGLALLAGFNRPAAAVVVDGRLTSSVYSYVAPNDSATTTTFLRANQGLRLDLAHLGGQALSFHTYMQGSTDFGESASNDPRLRLYDAYFSWKKDANELQLGRQRISAGAGLGRIDGARISRRGKGWDLDLYAGALAPLDKGAGLGSWSEGNLWGVRVRTSRLLGADLGLSVARRQRELASGEDLVRQLASLEGRRLFRGKHSLYARLDYDQKDAELQRAQVDARLALAPRLSLQANWLRRLPAVYEGSFFNMFPQDAYQEAGASVYFQATGQVQLAASFAQILYADDNAQRLGLTLSTGPHYSLGYYRTMGYARASDGLAGNLYYSLGRKLSLNGQLDLATFERYEEAEDRDGLASGGLGLSWKPVRAALIEAQVQALRNPAFSSDLRFLLRGSWHFFKGEGEK
ncbi:MAG: hypothetical protein IT369_06230 [Candidatus Latescibacteria bacterium]|nr:hypothetical protein [Candidatus Latescibacterota bacterium]